MKLIDPKLVRRVHASADGGAEEKEIRAVITVQDLSPQAKPLAPEATESIVDELVRTVRNATGIEPAELRVQRNLGTFVISAKADFMRKLLEQSGVYRATSADAPRQSKLK